MESRTLLASVSDGGGSALTLALTTNEALAIVSNGTSYTFNTNQTFTNGGVAATGDFSAFGAASLTLKASGLNRYVLVNVFDTGTNAAVSFNDSGLSSYSDAFFVSLDNAAGPITFNGATALTGFASLSASTTNDINLASGSSVRTARGDLALSSGGSNTDLTVSGSAASESGDIDLTATGHLTVATGAGLSSATGSVKLGADLMAGGTGDDGSGTLTIQAGATVYGANITLRGADTDIASTATVGSAVAGDLALASTLTGLNSPTAMAFDSAGNLFVANQADNTVSKFAPGATTATSTLTGLAGPLALAFDSSGNLYVANSGSLTVSRFAPGATTANASLLVQNGPSALAFDSAGNLYVANFVAGTVSKFLPGATVPAATLTGLVGPRALAFDGSGNLFVANNGGGAGTTVSVFAPGATTPSATLTGLQAPSALAFDTSGNLFVSNSITTTVSKFSPGATTPSATLSGGLFGPQGLAFDSNGNLFVVNGNGTTVSRFAPGDTSPTATLTGLSGPRSLAFDQSGSLFVSNFAVGGGGTTVSKFGLPYSRTAAVNIQSSVGTRPMSLGGSNSGVAGVNLTDAELARIFTASTGAITVGSGSQTGNITLTTATLASTAGATTVIVQSGVGNGQIILNDGGNAASALQGNGGSVSLTAGSGGIASLTANNSQAEIATSGATVALNTSGAIGTSTNRIQLADQTNTAVQNVVIGSTIQPSSVYLDGLGNLTLVGISGGDANTTIDVTARRDLLITAGATLNSGTNSLNLGADLTAAGPGDAGSGTLTIAASASVYGANLSLRGADIDIASTATVGSATAGNVLVATLTGLRDPVALAFDSSGNLFVVNQENNSVQKFAPGTTTPSQTLRSGLDFPVDLAIDRGDNLFVASLFGHTVQMFAPGATAPGAQLVGAFLPSALAFDGSGNLFVADQSTNTVLKYPPGATTPSDTLVGLIGPSDLAFDGSGNLFVANLGNGTVSRFAPGAVVANATLTGLNRPVALAFDASGNLFVVNQDGNTVSRFSPGATVANATLTGLNKPSALAFDGHGNLYVVNSGSNTVSRFPLGATVADATISGLNSPTALVFDRSGNLFVANNVGLFDTVSQFALGVAATTTLSIQSSLVARPMSLGGTNTAVAGINLTDAELARIITASAGTVTVGSSSQSGNITLTTATPATTAGAATVVVQSTAAEGRIILDDGANMLPALNGNGGSITLTAGIGGITALASNNTAAEITTSGAAVTLNTAGAIGTSINRIQLADNANSAQQVVYLGSPQQLSSVFLDGLGSLTLGGIAGGGSNTAIDITARANVIITAGATLSSGAGALSLGADLTAAGAGNDGSGTLTIQAGAGVYGGNIRLRGADVDISSTANVGRTTAGNVLAATLTGLNGPSALAFDGSGNLFVANNPFGLGTTVSRFSPNTSSSSTTLTGLDGPQALAVDGGGNLFVANFGSGLGTTVSKFAPGAATPSDTLSGLSGPAALAVDSSGNLYVANFNANTVSKFAPGASTPSATLTGLNGPIALVFDSSGNLYAANNGNGTVSKFAPGATTASATLTGLNSPIALAISSSGDLLVANQGNSTVSRFAPGGTTPSATLSGLTNPIALAFDGRGNLLVANGNGTTVSQFAPGALTPTATLTGFNKPAALAFDGSGNLHVANSGATTVSKLALAIGATSTVGLQASLATLPIEVGTNSSGSFGLTDGELDRLSAAELQIGSAASGAITISAAITRTTATSISMVSGGAINFTYGSLDSAGGNVMLTSGNAASVGVGNPNIEVTATAGTLSFASGTNLAIPINGKTSGQPGGYDQLVLSGNVNLSNNHLQLSGTYTPAIGDQFTIVSNSLATGLTTGTFADLMEGAVFNPGVGSLNVTFAISYHGGDGNDVVLTVVNTAPSFTKGADQAATDESPAQSFAGWATNMLAGPPNEAGQKLSFQVSVPAAQQGLFAVLPQVDATGKLTFTPQPNASGSIEVSVALLDDGGTANGGSNASAPQLFNITITKPHPWHNVLHALDVTNSQANGTDTIVAPGDALAIINYINTNGAGQIPMGAAIGQPYLDTWNSTTNTYSGDNFVVPADALAVINFINQFGNGQPGPAGEGEGEATTASQPDHNLLSSDLISLLALDMVAAGSPRRR